MGARCSRRRAAGDARCVAGPGASQESGGCAGGVGSACAAEAVRAATQASLGELQKRTTALRCLRGFLTQRERPMYVNSSNNKTRRSASRRGAGDCAGRCRRVRRRLSRSGGVSDLGRPGALFARRSMRACGEKTQRARLKYRRSANSTYKSVTLTKQGNTASTSSTLNTQGLISLNGVDPTVTNIVTLMKRRRQTAVVDVAP